MSDRPINPVAVAAGVVAVVVGVLLALEVEDSLSLGAGWIAALLCAAAGAILVAGGLSRGDG